MSTEIYAAQMAADYLIFHLARRAGIKEEDSVVEVEEIFFEVDDLKGFGMEAWTQFTAEDIEGQRYIAHLPGRLDELLARTVQDHALILELAGE